MLWNIRSLAKSGRKCSRLLFSLQAIDPIGLIPGGPIHPFTRFLHPKLRE